MRNWPNITSALFGGTDEYPWIRAQPKGKDHIATTPCILTAGATALKTQPDGMFIRPINDFRSLDVVCFEICSSLQNLQDKRSRYNPSTSALIVETRARWWNETVQRSKTRWNKATQKNDLVEEDDWFPIRYLRVAYVLSKPDLENFRENGVAAGHEYFLRWSSLKSMTAKPFQDFLARMSPKNHFYTN